MKKETIFLLVINLSVIHCRCPVMEQLHPCSCDIMAGDPGIHCFGTEVKTLPQILQQLNRTNFDELIIHNTSIAKIDDDFFGNVTFFEFIHISHNSLLTEIGSNSLKKGPKKLSIVENKQLSGQAIFAVVKNCENCLELDLQSNFITEIPAFAFKLNNNSALSKLKGIDLSNNKIAKIDNNGLTFSSGHKIDISLKNNLLNENSFKEKSLENNGSVVLNIDFSDNLFGKLPENTFRTYFKNKKNNLTFGSTKFECDCSMKWILDDGIKIQIGHVLCANFHNQSLFQLTKWESDCLIPQTTVSTIVSTTLASNVCPSPEDLKPCVCDQNILSLSCDKTIINTELLTRIWLKIIAKNSFDLLNIRETNITTISRDTFVNIKVENVVIQNNDKLKSLDMKAFNGKKEINSFALRNNSNFNDLNIFELMRILNPNEVDLSRNCLKEIPSEAFADENGIRVYRIKSLKLDYNKIETIGSNAFVGLTKLTHLSLDHNMIKTLEEYSLKFVEISGHLFVSLKNNHLDNNSLNERTISLGQKPTMSISLHLDNNNLTTIKENFFSKLIFSTNNNEFNFFGNKFICDCNMKWLLNTTHESNILNIMCINKNRSLLDLSEKDLSCIL